MRGPMMEGGLHAIAFVDLGLAWANPDHEWDIHRQQIQADVNKFDFVPLFGG